MKVYEPNPKENEAIMASYKKIYKKNFFKNPLFSIEDFFFGLLLKFNNFLSHKINSWACRVHARTKDKYKGRVAESAFATVFSKTDPNINKPLSLDAKKERIYQTKDVQNLSFTIKDMTDGKYGKDEFKWDLFGHLLKKKKNDLNITDA